MISQALYILFPPVPKQSCKVATIILIQKRGHEFGEGSHQLSVLPRISSRAKLLSWILSLQVSSVSGHILQLCAFIARLCSPLQPDFLSQIPLPPALSFTGGHVCLRVSECVCVSGSQPHVPSPLSPRQTYTHTLRPLT